ncbi:MAG: Rrf2 family transcriptional regulator [Polyangiaceae bacterium]|nr:Rrf2 family transcriptional regulator [Polyangiaceae bacterium]
MKLSNKGQYAVRALFDIAFFNAERLAQVKDIADRQQIPPRFLEQIFQDLKRAGIVATKRGPQGGYRLARPPVEIRLGDVVHALEGPLEFGESRPGEDRAQPGAVDSRWVTESVFHDLSSRIKACFDAVTIADLCARADELGLRGPGGERGVHVI